MIITGNTRLFAILADPVAQVRTPQVLNDYCAAHGIDAVMVPMHVPPGGLDAAIAGLRGVRNLDGLIATVPHKTAMAGLCDALGPAGRIVGAVNTVRRTPDGRLLGEMFDGEGFVGGLRSQGHDPAGRKALLLGAGGAAAAIAFALVQAGAAVTIANRTPDKAQEIVRRVRAALPQAQIAVGDPDPRGVDMVVNATTLGMRAEDALPLDVALLAPGTLVAEIIMKPETTALLAQAQARGCAIHHGRHMLDAQARLMARFMLGETSAA